MNDEELLNYLFYKLLIFSFNELYKKAKEAHPNIGKSFVKEWFDKQQGIQMSNNKVIICGVVKNVESRIDKNIKHALETGSRFEKFKLVIYENNSTDNTKERLNYYENNKNIKIDRN